MNADVAVEHRILEMIAELSAVRPAEIRVDDRLREDLGLDSVASMELLSLLAAELHLDIEVEDALQVTTVGQTLAMARRYLGARAAQVS